MSAGTAYYLTDERALPGPVTWHMGEDGVLRIYRARQEFAHLHFTADQLEGLALDALKAARRKRMDALADAMAAAERGT